MRYFYTIFNFYYQYHTLQQIIKNKKKVFDRVIDISSKHLADLGVRILVLDFDGVLNSHGECLPRLDVVAWLKQMQAELGAENILILSNKPLTARIQFFTSYFPKIQFIQGVRKKPYPDGLEAVFKLKYISTDQRQQVALVDDRLLTGILATCIVGCQGLYIQSPYRQFCKRPIQESFFQGLRWIERLCLFKR